VKSRRFHPPNDAEIAELLSLERFSYSDACASARSPQRVSGKNWSILKTKIRE